MNRERRRGRAIEHDGAIEHDYGTRIPYSRHRDGHHRQAQHPRLSTVRIAANRNETVLSALSLKRKKLLGLCAMLALAVLAAPAAADPSAGPGVRAQPPTSTSTARIVGLDMPSALQSPAFIPTPAPRPIGITGTPCASVSLGQQLIEALGAGDKCIFVASDAEINLGELGEQEEKNEEKLGKTLPGVPEDAVLQIPEGVTLESGRSPTVQGGLLFMKHKLTKKRVMLDLGANTRITGLRLRGYNQSDTTPPGDQTDGIAIRKSVDNILIDNNEIFWWPEAAVDIKGASNDRGKSNDIRNVSRIHITGNFIHNNCRNEGGYGVAVGKPGGFALIDRNVFNFDRHDVADDGTPGTGYIAELNFVLTSGPREGDDYNQHFDVHGTNAAGSSFKGGTAGDYFDIRNNTIRGAQNYGHLDLLTRPAFELRGEPTIAAIFEKNAVEAAHSFTAVAVRGVSRFKRTLVIRDNQYDVHTASELAVGKFGNDGCSDVFQATGAVWVYSPCGRGIWRFLNQSSLRLNSLALGDFNGDGKTDVFTQSGARWLVSYGGTSAFQPLPAGSNIPMKYYRFGDFDGDGKTDIFRANGSHFYVSSGGATAWKQLATSSLKIDNLRFGDFNGDGKTDVFSLANHQWSVSYGGVTQWQRLNSELSSNLGQLVFADFNGDGRTDIARSNHGKWEVSFGGATPWQLLNRSGPGFFGMLFGDFNGDKRADVLQYITPSATGSSFPRYKLSSGGVSSLVPWSEQDMV
jgi:FG-GAP-like repeat